MNRKRGKFIVLDGIDGAGKGTQLKNLFAYLFDRDKNHHPWGTREPYLSSYAIRARRLLKSGKNPRKNGELFLKLFVADRREHAKVIADQLRRGHHVICDRYKYSTLAYQQAQAIFLDRLLAAHRGILVPDLVCILDLPVVEALRRQAKDDGRSFKEVFEKDSAFQEQVRKNFLELPKVLSKERIIIIDGSQPPRMVFESIRKEIEKILK